jgi:hypothetical protein
MQQYDMVRLGVYFIYLGFFTEVSEFYFPFVVSRGIPKDTSSPRGEN